MNHHRETIKSIHCDETKKWLLFHSGKPQNEPRNTLQIANVAMIDSEPHLVSMIKSVTYINPFKPSVLFYGTSVNSAEPDQTPQIAASDQVLHCLLTECSIIIRIKIQKNTT